MAEEIHKVTNSSFITEIKYDEDNKILVVTMKHGKEYEYLNVPIDVFKDFKNADSAGAFYSANVKGKFEEM